MLFAQRAGTLTVPPVPVDVEVKTWGAGAGTRIQRMSTPRVEFFIRTPPGAEGIRGLISTADLTANQNWTPEIDSPVVGDALKRTITLRAEDVSGMAFAPISHNRTEDLGIYPGEPEVDDRFARGDLTGTRIETVTYVFERAGAFEIPDLEFSWWDVGAGELKLLVLPGLSLQVAGNAVAETATDGRWCISGVLRSRPGWVMNEQCCVKRCVGLTGSTTIPGRHDSISFSRSTEKLERRKMFLS